MENKRNLMLHEVYVGTHVAFRAGNSTWVKSPPQLCNYPGLLRAMCFKIAKGWEQTQDRVPVSTFSHRPLRLPNVLTS